MKTRELVSVTEYRTGDDAWVDVEGVVDGVDAAPPVVPLAEREGAPVHADARHVCVATQRDLRQSHVLEGGEEHYRPLTFTASSSPKICKANDANKRSV